MLLSVKRNRILGQNLPNRLQSVRFVDESREHVPVQVMTLISQHFDIQFVGFDRSSHRPSKARKVVQILLPEQRLQFIKFRCRFVAQQQGITQPLLVRPENSESGCHFGDQARMGALAALNDLIANIAGLLVLSHIAVILAARTSA